jgi:hypothetical protein
MSAFISSGFNCEAGRPRARRAGGEVAGAATACVRARGLCVRCAQAVRGAHVEAGGGGPRVGVDDADDGCLGHIAGGDEVVIDVGLPRHGRAAHGARRGGERRGSAGVGLGAGGGLGARHGHSGLTPGLWAGGEADAVRKRKPARAPPPRSAYDPALKRANAAVLDPFFKVGHMNIHTSLKRPDWYEKVSAGATRAHILLVAAPPQDGCAHKQSVSPHVKKIRPLQIF